MKKINWLEIFGWLAGIALISAYALNAFSVIPSTSRLYLGLNFVSSLYFAYYTYRKKAYPNTVLNIIWGIVAFLALIGIMK